MPWTKYLWTVYISVTVPLHHLYTCSAWVVFLTEDVTEMHWIGRVAERVYYRSRILERAISLRFLGIILSITTFAQEGGGGSKISL